MYSPGLCVVKPRLLWQRIWNEIIFCVACFPSSCFPGPPLLVICRWLVHQWGAPPTHTHTTAGAAPVVPFSRIALTWLPTCCKDPPPKNFLLAASISMETSRNHGNYLTGAKRFQNRCTRPLSLPLFSLSLQLSLLAPFFSCSVETMLLSQSTCTSVYTYMCVCPCVFAIQYTVNFECNTAVLPVCVLLRLHAWIWALMGLAVWLCEPIVFNTHMWASVHVASSARALSAGAKHDYGRVPNA